MMSNAGILRCLIALFLACGLITDGSARGISSKRILAAILKQTPEPEIVSGRPMEAAEYFARTMGPEVGVFWGTGDSMEPMYAHNTALVVAEADYENLKKGMTVIYLDSRGMRVAHCIVGETKGGYIMQGIGNSREDDALLTPNNFVGVIVKAFASSRTEFFAATRSKLGREKSLTARGLNSETTYAASEYHEVAQDDR